MSILNFAFIARNSGGRERGGEDETPGDSESVSAAVRLRRLLSADTPDSQETPAPAQKPASPTDEGVVGPTEGNGWERIFGE